MPSSDRRYGRGRRFSALTIAILLWLALPPANLAQVGPKVVRILIEGNERISDEAVLHLMTVREGDSFDEEVLREEFKRIWARGLFEDLSIESRDAPGGKAVIVHVSEKPIVTSLRYDESKVVGETQIEDALDTRNAQIAIGEPVDYSMLKKAEEGIKTLLNQKGFLDAEVTSETRDLGGGNVEVYFDIREGAKTRIRSIEFVGNEVFSDRELKGSLKLTKEKGWFTRFRQKDVYHPLKFDTDLRNVETLYNNLGYIDLELPPPTVTVVEEKTKKKEGKSRKWVALEQRVIEGEQYRVGEIRIEGNTVYTDQELMPFVRLLPGDILRENAVRASLALIDAKYGGEGYFYVSTNRLLDRHDDATADLTIKVNEDQQYHLDRLEFTGNLTTRDFVLRREFTLAEGDLFDLNKFRSGLRRIAQQGHFQLKGEPEITPVPGENKLRVEIEGTEPRRSELQIGGGYSGLDGGFFAASYQTRNFLGRGNLVSVNGQVGSIASRYVVSFTEPYLLGRPINAGFSVFRRDQDYVGFRTSGEGGSVTLGRRFGASKAHNISGTFLHETTDLDPTDGISSTSVINSVRPFYLYDTRNNYFRPSSGFQFLVSNEYAGGVMGGDTSFVKPQVEFQWYIPLFKNHFVALHGEVGYVRAISDQPLPAFERFFLGGERSMRNYGTRTVAPRGFVCNFGQSEVQESVDDCPGRPPGFNHSQASLGFLSDAVGGNRNVLFNFEYVIPLSQPIDFLFYVDAGNAFAEWEPINMDLIRGDAGVELRFFLPVFGAPLRLIYGQTFNETGEEDTKTFLFSIGRTF